MREKIDRIAKGVFDENLPKIEMPKKPISWEMDSEDSFTGYLSFRSENGVRIRGYVICTDTNLKISHPQFYAKNVKIEFTYISKNTAAGDKKRGKLILITNGGEFLVPFEVRIRKNVVEEGV